MLVPLNHAGYSWHQTNGRIGSYFGKIELLS
jgi:hypothetical protein